MFLDHPNIAKVYGVIVEEKNVHLLMEYCHDGNLSENLFEYKGESSNSCEVLSRLALAVEYLHDKNIQHRDLKLENILMSLGMPKISDFELSVYVRESYLQRKTICGSPVYFSPEMLSKEGYTRKADIWCLGIIFYEVLCGYFPFNVKDFNDLS